MGLAYLAVGIPLMIQCINQLDSDGVSYLLLAEHCAKGQWAAGVSGHWSPLLPWLTSLLMRLGISPPAAARTILLLSGLGWAVAALLLFDRLGLHAASKWAATLIVAMFGLGHSVELLSPDLLVAAILSVYLWQSLDDGLVHHTGAPFKCGLVAGIAYLAKAYAFPFFVLHFSVLAVVYARRSGPGATGRALRTIALGLGGAAVFVLPWATILSAKYGRPTINTAGTLSYAVFGPTLKGEFPVVRGLHWPREGRLNPGEAPNDGTFSYPGWSPFADLASFKYQLSLIYANLKFFRRFIGAVAHWGILIGVVFYTLLVILSGRHRAAGSLSWAVWTVVAYASGYLLIIMLGRYCWVLEPVLVAMAFLLLELLVFRNGAQAGKLLQRLSVDMRAYPAVLLLTTVFMINPVVSIYHHFTDPPNRDDVYVARQLSSLPLDQPMAANDWFRGLYVSYRLRMKYLGRPASDSPRSVAKELRKAQVGTFLIWGDTSLAEGLDNESDMYRITTLEIPREISGEKVIVFDVTPAGDR